MFTCLICPGGSHCNSAYAGRLFKDRLSNKDWIPLTPRTFFCVSWGRGGRGGNLWVSQRFDLNLSIVIFKNPTYTVNYMVNVIVASSDDELICVNGLLNSGLGYEASPALSVCLKRNLITRELLNVTIHTTYVYESEFS